VQGFSVQGTFTKAEVEDARAVLKSAVANAVSKGITIPEINDIAHMAEKETSNGQTKFVVYNATYGGFGITDALKDLCKEVHFDPTFHPDPNDKDALLVEAAVRLGKRTYEGTKENSTYLAILYAKESEEVWSPEGSVLGRAIKTLKGGVGTDESKRRRAFLDLGLIAGSDKYAWLAVEEVGLKERVRIEEYEGLETVISSNCASQNMHTPV